MACGSCAKRRQAAMQNMSVNQLQASEVQYNQPEHVFVRKRYIGERQRLSSVNESLSYGIRNPGEVLVILEDDFNAHPEWWQDV